MNDGAPRNPYALDTPRRYRIERSRWRLAVREYRAAYPTELAGVVRLDDLRPRS